MTGEVVTNNARVFKNVPLRIPYQGRLVLRGEAIITYSDFERINESIEDVDAKYKNPRNLCKMCIRDRLTCFVILGNPLDGVVTNFAMAENIYKVPNDLRAVCDVIHQNQENDFPRVVFDGSLNSIVRQYDACLLYTSRCV